MPFFAAMNLYVMRGKQSTVCHVAHTKSLVVALELVRPWCLSRQAPDSNEDSNWKARGSYLVFNFKTLLLPNGFIIDRERSTVESLTSLNSVRKSTSFPDAP